jgi:gamma-glutamyltranspeptidase/glutathione hydrolase
VATTQTVNTHFGSCLVPPGTGVFLNNEMDDFALVPGAPNAYGLLGNKANAPAPGKRMLSSMSPTFVFGPERVGVLGSPGGSTIITQVFEGILAFMHGDSAAQIAATPRYHHQYLPDVVYVEPEAFDAATTKALTGMGYDVKPRGHWGFMNVVTWNLKTNTLDAASDPRHESGLGEVQ